MDIKGNYQVWSISFFDKKTGWGASVNEELAQDLHKPVNKKSKRKKVYKRFKIITHNIVWRKFSSLFRNIVKRGKGVETWNCPVSSFSLNFCHWLSEEIGKI